jgi:hypothetical protein
MKHLKRFESKAAEEMVNTLGDDAEDSQTIGLGKPCVECNCCIEDCDCGCQTCKKKQKQGQVFKKEPIDQDYSLDSKPAKITEKLKHLKRF